MFNAQEVEKTFLLLKIQLELRGIDPRTSHMLSERSTIWATAPDGIRKLIESCDWNPIWLANITYPMVPSFFFFWGTSFLRKLY